MPNTKTNAGKSRERERVNGIKNFLSRLAETFCRCEAGEIKNLSNSILKGAMILGVGVFVFGMGASHASAATITAKTTGGNWSSTSTWVGDVLPNPATDTVVIPTGLSAAVVLNDSRTIPATTVQDLTYGLVQGLGVTTTLGGILTIGNGASADGLFTLGTGSEVATNGNNIVLNNCKITSNSTTSQWAKITGTGSLTTGAAYQYPKQAFDLSYVSFTNTGNITFSMGYFSGAIGEYMSLNHVIFDGTGQIAIGTGGVSRDKSVHIYNSDFRNIASAEAIKISWASSITRTDFIFDGCTFDNVIYTAPQSLRFYVLNGAIQFKNCNVRNWTIGGGGYWPANSPISNVFHIHDNTMPAGSTGIFYNSAYGNFDIQESYFYQGQPNPHGAFSVSGTTWPSGGSNNIFSNNVIETATSGSGGASGMLLNGGANFPTTNIIGNIKMGNGEFVALLPSSEASGGDINISNNTYYLNSIGEIGAMLAFEHLNNYSYLNNINIKNNIGSYDTSLSPNTSSAQFAYDDTSPYTNLNSFSYNDLHTPSDTPVAGYTVTTQTGNITSNPQFNDPARNLAKWNLAYGSGTESVSDGAEYFMERNGYDSITHTQIEVDATGASADALLSYIRTGFTPTNMTLATAGYSGTYIGAVPPVDTTTPTITTFSIPASSTSHTLSVTFTATDDSGTVSGYCLTETNDSSSCSWSGTAPTSYTFSTDGAKTLYAFAKDAVPNISASSSATTTIDSTPPTLAFTDDVAVGPTQTDTITPNWGDADTKKWDYNTTDTCSTDDVDYTKTDADSLDQTTEAHNGKYICLYAQDSLGNYSTLASTNPINIDITAPTTTINSHPDASTVSTDAAFIFTSNETATFECKLDSGAFAPCSSPKSYTTLAEGEHTFEVKSIDTAGNADAIPESFTWTIDSIPPTLSNVAPNNTTLANTATSTSLTLNTNETATCKYATTDIDFGSMTLFNNTASTNHSTLITGLNPNTTYTYYLKCQDNATNESSTQLTFSVEAVADSTPTLEKIEIKIERTINKFKDTIRVAKNKLKFQQTDTNLANGQVKIYKGKTLWKTMAIDENGEWDKVLKFKDDFDKTIKIRQYDQFGSLLATSQAKIKVDTEKPTFENPFSATITTQPINFKATDNDQISYYKVKLLDAQGHTIRSWKKQTKSSFTVPENIIDQAKTIQVRAYDKVGNFQEEQANIQLGKNGGQSATIPKSKPVSGQSASSSKEQINNPTAQTVSQPDTTVPETKVETSQPEQAQPQGQKNFSWWNPWTW